MPAEPSPAPRSHWLAVALLCACVWVAYSSSFGGQFLFDDTFTTKDNPLIHRLWPMDYGKDANRWVVMFTFAINYAISGENTWSYHAFNVLFHSAVAVTFYTLVLRTLCTCGDPCWSRHAADLALASSLVWCVHPLTTQAVTYIYQRSECLASLAYLSAILLYAQGARASARGWMWFLAATICCVVGGYCKEILITAPAAILWYDRVFLSRSWRTLFSSRALAIALVGCSSVWLLIRMKLDTAKMSAAGIGGGAGWTPLQYLQSQPRVLLTYLRTALLPLWQSIDYGWKPRPFSDEWLWGAALLVLLVATLWLVVRRPVLGFFFGMPWLILSPTSSVVPVIDLAFEHRMYLPLAFLIAATAMAVSHVWAPSAEAATPTSPAVSRSAGWSWGWGVVALAVLCYGSLTWQRNFLYHDPALLWSESARFNPSNARAFSNLSVAYRGKENWAGAAQMAQRAVELNPRLATGWSMLGEVALHQQDHARAVPLLQQALDLIPRLSGTRMMLIDALKPSDPERALQVAEAGIRLDPTRWGLQTRAAMLYWKHRRDCANARQAFDAAIEWEPREASTYNNCAAMLVEMGDLPTALRYAEMADRLAPNSVATRTLARVRELLRSAPPRSPQQTR